MAVRITGIEKRSHAFIEGLKSGDLLISINNNEINDVLDYMFYISERELHITVKRNCEELSFNVIKNEYDDLGLQFDSFLMDDKKSCHNKCIFCFIDQMPSDMRETLYFKDDDARLSFLQGNYVTLTNLNQHDIDRIIKMKLNINVSVHTTNPELRCFMMNNRFAGEKLDYLYQLSKAGIKMNCQIVLCPDINDGKELERTLNDLSSMMPNIQSIAVVPVGLTKYRNDLYPLKPFDKKKAEEALSIIEGFQNFFLKKYRTRLVFPSDEFYIRAAKKIPETDFYEDYPQYENGVGMLRSLDDEFRQAMNEYNDYHCSERKVSIATGCDAYPYINNLIKMCTEKWRNFNCCVYPIVNDFFGENITVSGLITGNDIISQLKDKELGSVLYIPSAMLRRDSEIFLDDVMISQVEKELSVQIIPVENDGFTLFEKIMGIEN